MKQSPELLHRQRFTIRGYDVGMFLQANVLSIIRILHDAAVDQVIDLGFSALQLESRHLAWVLTQQHLEIFDRPKLGDSVEVLTYPSGVERAFTYRDYYLYSVQGRLLARASTSWILMDTLQRKISPFPPDIEEILKLTSTLEHLPRPPRIKVFPSQASYLKTFEASYYELDFNNHVSNHYFFRWMLDAIPIDYLRQRRIQTLNVRFSGEVQAGDKIISRVFTTADSIMHHILESDDKTIATGISYWS